MLTFQDANMLKRIFIDNYRSFVEFECKFDETQLILGSNGSGKTNFFDLLARIRNFSAYGTQNDMMFGEFTTTRWQAEEKQSFEFEVEGNGESYNFRLEIDTWGSPARPRVLLEQVLAAGKPIFRFAGGEVQLFNDRYQAKEKYPFDPHRSALATVSPRTDDAKLAWFKQWLQGIWFVNPDPHRMNGVAEKEENAPKTDFSNFANWYRHLRQEADVKTLHDLQADLMEVIPGALSMDLRDAGLGNRVLGVTIAESERNGKGSDFYVFNELSDGQRILAALYTVLHFGVRPGNLLVFDEPDNFLALAEIQPWLSKLLEKTESEGTQVFIASHHPELINRLAIEHGLYFDRPEGKETIVRPFRDPNETGLPPADLISRGWEHE